MKILDCTLRDGGHVNDAKFGKRNIVRIIDGLVTANLDYVELGFLKNGEFTEDQSSFNDVVEIYPYLPENLRGTEFTVMVRPDWYDIKQLSRSDGRVQIIRFAFYYRHFQLMEKYAEVAGKLGYRFICNPVNIMGYSEQVLKELIKRVNGVHPEQVTLVDTYGAMTMDDLHRIYYVVESNLDKDIRIGLHLHENQALAFGLAQEFIRIKESGRQAVIDGSLYGMGRIPGNLCIELIANYLNITEGKSYDEDILYTLIGECIAPIKKMIPWGYAPEYFITAKYKMHRSYAEYLNKKENLTLRDKNEILKSIEEDMRPEFHMDHLEQKYQEYMEGKD